VATGKAGPQGHRSRPPPGEHANDRSRFAAGSAGALDGQVEEVRGAGDARVVIADDALAQPGELGVRGGGAPEPFVRGGAQVRFDRSLVLLRQALDDAAETVRWVAGFDFPDAAIDVRLLALAEADRYAIESGVPTVMPAPEGVRA
jgi:hypothetical protein